MELEHLLIGFFIVAILLIKCYLDKKEGFSLSKKSMEHDWSLLHMNPFDNIDYQTPRFYPVEPYY